jgi:hypothetical protein
MELKSLGQRAEGKEHGGKRKGGNRKGYSLLFPHFTTG